MQCRRDASDEQPGVTASWDPSGSERPAWGGHKDARALVVLFSDVVAGAGCSPGLTPVPR